MALVRAPAALSVPGDVFGGWRHRLADAERDGFLGLPCGAGMALNDYADAAVDAVERPGRQIPSGRAPS